MLSATCEPAEIPPRLTRRKRAGSSSEPRASPPPSPSPHPHPPRRAVGADFSGSVLNIGCFDKADVSYSKFIGASVPDSTFAHTVIKAKADRGAPGVRRVQLPGKLACRPYRRRWVNTYPDERGLIPPSGHVGYIDPSLWALSPAHSSGGERGVARDKRNFTFIYLAPRATALGGGFVVADLCFGPRSNCHTARSGREQRPPRALRSVQRSARMPPPPPLHPVPVCVVRVMLCVWQMAPVCDLSFVRPWSTWM